MYSERHSQSRTFRIQIILILLVIVIELKKKTDKNYDIKRLKIIQEKICIHMKIRTSYFKHFCKNTKKIVY